MLTTRLCCVIIVAIALAPAAVSVEPESTDQFGNPEEPALRPYKWMWQGVKSLFYHTGESLVDGNMEIPGLGTVKVASGARKGTFELLEAFAKGSVYAPLPKDSKEYTRELHTTNEFIEQEMMFRHVLDMAAVAPIGIYRFAHEEMIPYLPYENATKVEIRKARAAEIREERKAAAEARADAKKSPDEMNKTRVEEAQESYVGDRAKYGAKKAKSGRGNLLRLAR